MWIPEISAVNDVRIRIDIDNPDLTLRKGVVGKLEIDVDAKRNMEGIESGLEARLRRKANSLNLIN